MPSNILHPALLAGGAGTRLWPVSRDSYPKQFLPLVGHFSTYQQALKRVSAQDVFAPPIVITNEEFRFFSARQAQEIGIRPKIALEPSRRDSGPAMLAAAMLARERDANAIVLALAADHVILDPDLFLKTCIAGRDAAAAGHIVTFGLRPSEPKTSYGYIRPGDALGLAHVYRVGAFVEKPDAETALRYVANGYLWNSGNFLFKAQVLIDELKRFEPEMVDAVEASLAAATLDLDFVRIDPAAFSRAPRKSIDYSLMEKTDKAAVIEGHFRWSDIGSWDAVGGVSDQDQSGNASRGPVVAIDAENCVIQSDGPLTALVGVKDLVVVSTPDAVLVVPRGRAEQVKDLVAALRQQEREEANKHRRIHRPWGYYDSVDAGNRFQVKRIVVYPGGILSLQKHLHRSEHWVIVRGAAEVTIGADERIIQENESVYIPVGSVHRLRNPGKIPLELIEVQTGSYLGEDDIVRLEDVYNRN